MLFCEKAVIFESGTVLANTNKELKKIVGMHELSVAQNIIEMVQQHVPPPQWKDVATVRVKIGAVAGIIPDSLEFSFQAITSNSSFSHVRLVTERIPFRVQCHSCRAVTENEDGFALCGECESADTHILSGTELQLAEIELNDPEPVV